MWKLLSILLLLGGAGAWNYHRNWQAEQGEARPYRGLDRESLESLAGALEAEVEALSASYEAAAGEPARVRSEGMLAEKVREFERVQEVSQHTRAIGERLSQSEGSLRRVRVELRRRDEEADGLDLHLRRLVGFGI